MMSSLVSHHIATASIPDRNIHRFAVRFDEHIGQAQLIHALAASGHFTLVSRGFPVHGRLSLSLANFAVLPFAETPVLTTETHDVPVMVSYSRRRRKLYFQIDLNLPRALNAVYGGNQSVDGRHMNIVPARLLQRDNRPLWRAANQMVREAIRVCNLLSGEIARSFDRPLNRPVRFHSAGEYPVLLEVAVDRCTRQPLSVVERSVECFRRNFREPAEHWYGANVNRVSVNGDGLMVSGICGSGTRTKLYVKGRTHVRLERQYGRRALERLASRRDPERTARIVQYGVVWEDFEELFSICADDAAPILEGVREAIAPPQGWIEDDSRPPLEFIQSVFSSVRDQSKALTILEALIQFQSVSLDTLGTSAQALTNNGVLVPANSGQRQSNTSRGRRRLNPVFWAAARALQDTPGFGRPFGRPHQ